MSSSSEEPLPPLSLGLEEDESIEIKEPLRFLRLPSGHILAYGGDNGNVSCLLPEVGQIDSDTEEDKNIKSNKFVIVQRYEDAIRCIAVSKDGKRLAIGFDTGKTIIYCFEQFVHQENHCNTTNEKLSAHPYVQALEKGQNSNGNDYDDFLLSQDYSKDGNDLDYFAGPDLGAPARDMIFIPNQNSHTKACPLLETYFLAIASEAGMFVVDVTNKDVLDDSDHWLEKESNESHNQCGIRGLSAGAVETFIRNSDNSPRSKQEIIVLASLAMDGRLCMWDFANKKLLQREEAICVPKKDVGEIHNADAFDRSCRPVMCNAKNNRSGNLDLVIGTPGKLMPVTRTLQSNHEDGKLKILEDKLIVSKIGHCEPIVTMLFLSDKFLITSGQDGRVLIWLRRSSRSDFKNMSSEADNEECLNDGWEVVDKYILESPATDLIVQQNDIEAKLSLLTACANGSFQVFDISSHYQNLKEILHNDVNSDKITEVNKENNRNNDQIPHAAGIESCSQEGPINSTTTLPSSKTPKKKDLSEGDDDNSSTTSFTKAKSVHFLEESEEIDANSVGKNKSEPASTSDASVRVNGYDKYSDEEDDGSFVDHGSFSKHTRIIDAVKPQPAFSPSSTPLDLKRRFLCWNHIGSVTLLQGDKNRNIIDINFSDSAFRRPISFTDNIDFIVGSIGESGGIFASDIKNDEDYNDGEDLDGLDEFTISERTKEAVRRDRKRRSKNSENLKPTGSSIFFYRFHTSNLVNRKNKDWHLVLPDGERVLGVACGDRWAAAVTSRRFLRLFSPGGNQNQILWLKGDPVASVGRGSLLAVFYHESAPLSCKTQQLGYTLWDVEDFRVLSRDSVSCLSKGSSLSWAGFSNDLSLMVMDTDGMLSLLFTTGQGTSDGNYVWEWAPVLDTVGLRKSCDDVHWPITVHNGKLVCVPLKGGNTYPDANRRPVTTLLGLKMPFAKSIVPRNSALEELSVRSNIALSQKNFFREIESNSESLEKEYIALCAQVDKVTLRLFSGMVDAGKLESAFDLVSRLHSEKSFDIAIKLADRQYRLADEVEKVKKYKFPHEDDNYENDCTSDDFENSNIVMRHSHGMQSKQVSPDSRTMEVRAINPCDSTIFENKRRRLE